MGDMTDKRQRLGVELRHLFLGQEATIYTPDESATTPRLVAYKDLKHLIGATVEQVLTYRVERTDRPVVREGWQLGFTEIPPRYIVVSEPEPEPDPDAETLSVIREALDVTDPEEADEMARQVLAGLRKAGVEL